MQRPALHMYNNVSQNYAKYLQICYNYDDKKYCTTAF